MILALDLSTKTGWAMLDGEKLAFYGSIRVSVNGNQDSEFYPMNYIAMARGLADEIRLLIEQYNRNGYSIERVIIEETNKGKNRYTQKMLEFIHYAVNEMLYNDFSAKVHYISTSFWRFATQVDYSKDDRATNNEINKQKSQSREQLYNEVKEHFSHLFPLVEHMGKMDRRRFLKSIELTIKEMVDANFSRKRIRIDGKIVSKVSKKDVAVRKVNELYGTSFKRKDNDICDSILIGLGWLKLSGGVSESKSE